MRVLLDSNVWRYLVDSDAVGRLVSSANRSGCRICISPASLFEAAHSRDSVLRARLLNTMTRPTWRRLMPEAFSEAMEIHDEVFRCRPEWRRPTEDLRMWRALKHDWVRAKGGQWDRVRNAPKLIQDLQGPSLDEGRGQAREKREDAKSWPASFRHADLKAFVAQQSGFDSELSSEAWRLAGLSAFKAAMLDPIHPYREWLKGSVNLIKMLSEEQSMREFWLSDVDLKRMPRNWLRWAFEFLQAMHKVSDGTPGDCQLGTYLLDVDLFISADRVFVEVAERCRRDAPFPIARCVRIPGGPQGVEATLETVAGARSSYRRADRYETATNH